MDWCKNLQAGIGQGLAVTAVGIGANNGQAMIITGTKSRGLYILWCGDTHIHGMMAYGDPGSYSMPAQDPSSNPIRCVAERDASSLSGIPQTASEWSVELVKSLTSRDFAWIYTQLSGYMQEHFGGPAPFQVRLSDGLGFEVEIQCLSCCIPEMGCICTRERASNEH